MYVSKAFIFKYPCKESDNENADIITDTWDIPLRF